jgi:polar amino acid transport system substrate-binding protein
MNTLAARYVLWSCCAMSLGMTQNVIAKEMGAEKIITMCVDNNDWKPFSFISKGTATGVFIDLMKGGASKAGYKLRFKPMPWDVCIKQVQEGNLDGAVPASYKAERAAFMLYPDDAATNNDSKWAVGKADYVVLVKIGTKDGDYEYSGDVKTLPQPVFVPRSYSIADDIKKQGLQVSSNARYDEVNLYQLLQSSGGSAVAAGVAVEAILTNKFFANKFKVSKQAFTTKTYYMPFAKTTKVPKADVQKIWDEIAVLRADSGWMRKTIAKYQK